MANDEPCRCCFRKGGPRVSVFDASAVDANISCADMLSKFTGCIAPMRDDGLPNSVCMLCASQIYHSYTFLLKYNQCYRVLSRMYPLPQVEVISAPVSSAPSEFSQEAVEASDPEGTTDNSRALQQIVRQDTCISTIKTEVDSVRNVRSVNVDEAAIAASQDRPLVTQVFITSDKHPQPNSLLYARPKKAAPVEPSSKRLKRKFTCFNCKVVFDVKKIYMKHNCMGEGPYICEPCKKEYKSHSSLCVHNLRQHHIEGSYKCALCKMTFSTPRALKHHALVHFRQIYKCVDCDQAFAHKRELNFHKRCHRQKKKFECNQCAVTFSRLTTLEHHNDRHHAKDSTRDS